MDKYRANMHGILKRGEEIWCSASLEYPGKIIGWERKKEFRESNFSAPSLLIHLAVFTGRSAGGLCHIFNRKHVVNALCSIMGNITDPWEATPVCWADREERSQGKPPHTTELRGNSVEQKLLCIPAADIPTRAATASSSANSKPISVRRPERNMASAGIEEPDSILWLEITALQK